MTAPATPYVASSDRYEQFAYRPVGRSGLKLPPREILRTAFDLGITHFDLANNYGTPYGSAEINFGRILKEDLSAPAVGHRCVKISARSSS